MSLADSTKNKVTSNNSGISYDCDMITDEEILAGDIPPECCKVLIDRINKLRCKKNCEPQYSKFTSKSSKSISKINNACCTHTSKKYHKKKVYKKRTAKFYKHKKTYKKYYKRNKNYGSPCCKVPEKYKPIFTYDKRKVKHTQNQKVNSCGCSKGK